jgi:Tfp pilus assembly protein PilV
MKRIGATLMEVVVATIVLGTVMMGFAMFQTATVKANQKERDRAFALQKATQIIEEMKAYSAADGAAKLDDYGQSETTYSFMLTTDAVSTPSDAISDNTPASKGYRYVRQIWVKPLPRDKGARQVTVRVFLSNGAATAAPKAGTVPLASVSNVFKSMPIVVLPSQAYEVYRISMWEFANATHPGNSYQYPTLYRDYGSRATTYLAAATSGLDVLRRDVNIAAYGRDTYYAPLYNDDDYWAHINSGYSAGSDISSPNTVPLNNVYFRPGMNGSDQGKRLSKGGGQSRYWFSSDGGQAYEPDEPTFGQVKHEASTAGLYEKQKPYTFADQYNHALRYNEHYEKATTRGSSTEPEFTLRTLLDDLIAGKRKNAMIVNDHADVFPMIPLRNYSDAAKVPAHDTDLTYLSSMWGVTPGSGGNAKDGSKARLVTHPYRMEYNTGDTVELRVHPYKADDLDKEPPAPYQEGQIVLRGMRDHLKDWNSNGGVAEDVEVQALVPVDYYMNNLNHSSDRNTFWRTPFFDDRDFRDVRKKGSKWKSGEDWESMRVYRWVRVWPNKGTLKSNDGTPNGGNAIPYVPEMATQFAPTTGAMVTVQTGANTTKGLGDGDVIIRLRNIPYTADKFVGQVYDKGWGSDWDDEYFGIDKNMTLHGMNYFPDPYLPELTEGYKSPDKQPRSSTRLRVLFQSKTAQTVEALTTIGSDDNLFKHQAPNRSRTWVWIKSPGSSTTVPETEQFQLVGDPRHNPYRDVRDARRYNRYFGDLDDAYLDEEGDTAWNYYADTANGWGPNTSGIGRADVDVPRYFELWRRALLNSNSMLGTITGNAFKHVVLGSEYDDVNHSKFPMTGEKNKKFSYDERENPTLVATKDGKWYAKPWLGELYPDDRWSDWIKGNLPSDDFRRLEVQNISSFPSEVKFKRTRTVDDWGPMSFFNSSTRFAYRDSVGKALITPDSGRAVTADLKALLREAVDVKRSYTLNDNTVSLPPDWLGGESTGWRTSIETGVVTGSAAYYKAPDNNHAVGPIVMRRNEGGSTKAAYFLASTPSSLWGGSNDPMSMQRVFMAAMIQGFQDMASPTYKAGGNKGDQRIRLLPRLKVTAPEDDASVSGAAVTITWVPEWRRWDGNEYSRQFTDYGSTADKPNLAYFVKYSEDGSKWYFANSNPVLAASIGSSARFNSATSPQSRTATSLDLDISKFKNKQYQVRIEAWRSDPGYQMVHHAYAQISINVNK